MLAKLDLKDRKLLYELDRGSRRSFAELGKKVGLSKETARNRVLKLIEAGYILKFYTITDISKLGYTITKQFIRFQNMSEEKESEFISFLVNSPHVVWVASMDGKFDLACGVWAKNVLAYESFVRDMMARYGQYIAGRELATILFGQYFVRDYLIRRVGRRPTEHFFGAVPEPAQLDAVDWKILYWLGKDARMPSIEIARKLKLSPDTIANRIKRLERQGVIRNYILLLNNGALSQMHYKVLIGLRDLTEEKEKALFDFCSTHPNIIYIVKALGPWEFEIDLEVADVEEFRKVMREVKNRFSEIIRDYSALSIYKIHKYNFCPSEVPP